MTIRQTLTFAAFSAAIAFATPLAHADNATPTGAPPARDPASAAPAGQTTSSNNSLSGGAQQQSSTGANNNAGANNPNPGRPQPTGATNRPAGQTQPQKQNTTANNTNTNRNRNLRTRETKLITTPNVVGTSTAVFIPFFGYAPINGFDYTTDYAGWNPNYDPLAAEALTEPQNTSPSTNPPAASPSASTSNPDAEAARNEMVTAQNRILKELQAKPDYQKALEDVRKAAADFNAAVAQANKSVSDTHQVKTAEAKARDADRQLDAQHRAEAQQAAHVLTPTTQPAAANSPGSFSPDATRAAQQKLEAKTQIKQTQNNAALSDPAVQQSREKLQAAVTRMNEIRAKYEADVVADKDWKAAHAKLDAAMAGTTRSNVKQ